MPPKVGYHLATRNDPDVRELCKVCRGEIYCDEPHGNTCIECRRTMVFIGEAHRAYPGNKFSRTARPLKLRLGER